MARRAPAHALELPCLSPSGTHQSSATIRAAQKHTPLYNSAASKAAGGSPSSQQCCLSNTAALQAGSRTREVQTAWCCGKQHDFTSTSRLVQTCSFLLSSFRRCGRSFQQVGTILQGERGSGRKGGARQRPLRGQRTRTERQIKGAHPTATASYAAGPPAIRRPEAINCSAVQCKCEGLPYQHPRR